MEAPAATMASHRSAPYGRLLILALLPALCLTMAVASVTLATANPLPFPVVTSPHPRFMAQIPQLKADWQKLSTDPATAAWYQYLQNHARSDAQMPSGWLTHHTITMYQLSGNASWAALAWQSALGNFINAYPNYDYSCCRTSYTCCPSSASNFYGGDGNAHDIAGLWVDTYDWIYTYLSPQQVCNYLSAV